MYNKKITIYAKKVFIGPIKKGEISQQKHITEMMELADKNLKKLLCMCSRVKEKYEHKEWANKEFQLKNGTRWIFFKWKRNNICNKNIIDGFNSRLDTAEEKIMNPNVQ